MQRVAPWCAHARVVGVDTQEAVQDHAYSLPILRSCCRIPLFLPTFIYVGKKFSAELSPKLSAEPTSSWNRIACSGKSAVRPWVQEPTNQASKARDSSSILLFSETKDTHTALYSVLRHGLQFTSLPLVCHTPSGRLRVRLGATRLFTIFIADT